MPDGTRALIDGRTRGFGVLLRDIAQGSADLMRSQVKLVRLEVAGLLGDAGRGSAMVAVGSVLLLLGSLAFAAGLVLLIGDQWLPRDRYWLASLLIMLVAGALAAWFARRGMSRLSPEQLAPDETIGTLKEDKEWLKQQLT